MKNTVIFSFFVICNLCSAQSFKSYRTKTTKNKTERTKILNLVREKAGDYLFIVHTLNVSSQYAWFIGEQIRKDNKVIETSEYEDCCHTEALLKKTNNSWKVIEFGINSTDLWWFGLWENYQLPKKFFIM